MQKKINYAIVSYNRPQCITVDSLKELSVKNEDIIVFLQGSNEDKERYISVHPNVQIILNQNSGCPQNRNNALKFFSNGDLVMLLDDDVISFTKLFAVDEQKVRSQKIRSGEEFQTIIRESFNLAQNIGAKMFGMSPTGNAIIAKTRLCSDGIVSINRLFQGGAVGHIIDKNLLYNETYNTVEDYEIQLRCYQRGDLCFRRNDISASKKPNRNYEGGLFDYYRSGKHMADLERLCKQYSQFIKLKPDYSGVKQIG